MHGRLVDYLGDRARVVFTRGDGAVLAMPQAPFRAASLQPGDWFVLTAKRAPGGQLVGHPTIKRRPPPRSETGRRATPAVYVRRGKSITTRR